MVLTVQPRAKGSKPRKDLTVGKVPHTGVSDTTAAVQQTQLPSPAKASKLLSPSQRLHQEERKCVVPLGNSELGMINHRAIKSIKN